MKVFKTLNDGQSYILNKFDKSKTSTNLNYHMSIKKSQEILKHFVDLKFSVWFTLCAENETMFCERIFSRSTADQDCQNTK